MLPLENYSLLLGTEHHSRTKLTEKSQERMRRLPNAKLLDSGCFGFIDAARSP